ncbi:hypothetical protein EDD11_009027 [Mortierella claussenii]|nr:hypothetical protein EDD11_009027 [Mortierella claussenii]
MKTSIIVWLLLAVIVTVSFASPLALARNDIADNVDISDSSDPKFVSRGSNSHPSDLETLYLHKRQQKVYLGDEELDKLVTIADYSEFKPVSTDSYSDSEIYKTIKQRTGLKVLLYATLQTAIVGTGDKDFGKFSYQGEMIDVRTVYREYRVMDDLSLQSSAKPEDLTPRRLQRFYRVQIHQYLEKNPKAAPYLWKKYSTHDERYRSITFPGAESLVTTREEGFYLLQTYARIDERLGTSFSERIGRVLLARGVLTITELHQ